MFALRQSDIGFACDCGAPVIGEATAPAWQSLKGKLQDEALDVLEKYKFCLQFCPVSGGRMVLCIKGTVERDL